MPSQSIAASGDQPIGGGRLVKPAMCHIAAVFPAIRRGLRSTTDRTRGIALVALLAVSLAGGPARAQTGAAIEQRFAASLVPLPVEPPTVTGAFYVPAYSSVSISQGHARADFSVTLSIHNASETRPLIVKRVAYFDTTGKQVESFLKAPIALKPFATIEIFVATTDLRGGTGANFVVDWAATGEIAEPVTEALMLGSLGAGHYAFISQGRAIRTAGAK
jgi:hypothetical protein